MHLTDHAPKRVVARGLGNGKGEGVITEAADECKLDGVTTCPAEGVNHNVALTPLGNVLGYALWSHREP